MNTKLLFLSVVNVSAAAVVFYLLSRQPLSALNYPSLASWASDGVYLNYNGHALFAISTLADTKSGPDLVLIHGYPTSSYDFKDTLSYLKQSNSPFHRIITFDFMGFGFSDKPPDGSHNYSVHSQCDQLEFVLAHYGVNQAHILAHDLGDTVMQEYLHRLQSGTTKSKVDLLSVSLLNGGILPEMHRPILLQTLMLNGQLRPILRNLMSRMSFDRSVTNVWGNKPMLQENDSQILAEMWAVVTHKGGTYAVCETIEYINERKQHRDEWVGSLMKTQQDGENRVPILLVNGVKDPVSGEHLAQRVENDMKGIKVVRIENAGHWPQVEQPETVANHVIQFVRAL